MLVLAEAVEWAGGAIGTLGLVGVAVGALKAIEWRRNGRTEMPMNRLERKIDHLTTSVGEVKENVAGIRGTVGMLPCVKGDDCPLT